MEGQPQQSHIMEENLVSENYEKEFLEYMEYFSLTEEDLRGSILDVGSGAGEFVKYIRNKFGNTHAFAVEKDESEFSGVSDGLVVADAIHLPFADNAFQTVTSKHFLPMFVANPEENEKIIYELIRVCKSGGKIMANISLPESVIEESKKEIYKDNENFRLFFLERIAGGHVFEVFLEKLKMEGYGIDIEKNKFILTIRKP
jgi:ubiquinone/menaquinone biosynthesis C-methylase UbiE